jgi:AraC family transcriptional regulator of adaptative response/methylated-DNA-[protein]-cysteine methyltransferase
VNIPAPPAMNIDERRWAALIARDPSAEADFVYAVKTSGLYCRPADGGRLPRRENIEFFDGSEQAEAAGYRPRQQVKGTAAALRRAQRVAEACRQIEQAEREPSLAQLAEAAHLSPWHFQRLFKAQTGLTPKRYAAACRARRLREQLSSAPSVTDALYQAGFGSSGRLYEAADAALGMTPGAYRRGGADQELYFALGECSLGSVLVAQSSRGVCAILLGDDPQALLEDLQRRFAHAKLIGADADFERCVAQVVGFIEAPALGLELPLDIRGTAFQQRVWQALRQIPPGTTASYAEIAERIGAPQAVRAVAGACAANCLAVAIPCHRVVRSDGGLSGYRWGLARKQQLLDREAGR